MPGTRRRVTITEVARHAGVSVAAVSRAINGSPHISPEMLERVNRSIECLGFRPTPAAQNLRKRRTGNIAFIIPSITNPFFPELVMHVHAEVHRRGFALLLVDAVETETEAEAIRVIQARIADGVLLVGSPGSERIPELGVGDVPSIAFDRAPRAWSTTVLQTENADGAAEVVAHLVDCGHTHIAHIAGPTGFDVSGDRARGYADALRARNIEPDRALTVRGDFSEDSGYQAVERLLESRVRFTAVFAANDLMAIGAMAALKDRGVHVPDDIAIAGFDGIHLGRYVNPPLTTYAQPIRLMAERGVELLIDAVENMEQIESALSKNRTRRRLRFAGELIRRESTSRRIIHSERTKRGDDDNRRGKHEPRPGRVRATPAGSR